MTEKMIYTLINAAYDGHNLFADILSVLYWQPRRILKFTLVNLKGFRCVSCKLPQITLVTNTFWVGVDLERFIKDA